MGNLILNSREKRGIFTLLKDQWDIEVPSNLKDSMWLEAKDGRVYLATREAGLLVGQRVERFGVYVGKRHDNLLRLSIEGSQIFGPFANHGTVAIDTTQAQQWLKGDHVNMILEGTGQGSFVLVHRGADFMGCGRYGDGRIYNFIPKERRLASNAELF